MTRRLRVNLMVLAAACLMVAMVVVVVVRLGETTRLILGCVFAGVALIALALALPRLRRAVRERKRQRFLRERAAFLESLRNHLTHDRGPDKPGPSRSP